MTDKQRALQAFLRDDPENLPGLDLTLNDAGDGFVAFETRRIFAVFERGFLLGRGWHD